MKTTNYRIELYTRVSHYRLSTVRCENVEADIAHAIGALLQKTLPGQVVQVYEEPKL